MTVDKSRNKGIRAFVRSWLPRHDDRLTKYFTFACLSTPSVFGAVSSVILNGGAVGGLLEVWSGSVRLSRDRGMVHLTVAIYGYCAAYLASFAMNPVTMESWRYLLPVVTFLLFPVLYSSWCMSRKRTVARSAVTASMIACYGALAVGAVQFHFYGMRAEGGAGNAIVFATMTCLAASVSLAGIFTMDRVFSGPLFGAFIAGGIAVLYSGSRITWAALFLVTAAILYIYRENLRVRVSRWTAAYAVLAIGAATIVGFQTIPPRVNELVRDWRQISLDGNYDSSLGRRAGLWQIGIEAALDSPVIGYGPQSTEHLVKERFHDKMGLEVHYGHFHNGFLTAWVETGLLGAMSLAAIFVIAARNAVWTLGASGDPTERLGAAILLVLVTTYLVSGLSGILVGHDILDSALVSFLVVGTFLSSGTSLLDKEVGEVSAAGGREPSASKSTGQGRLIANSGTPHLPWRTPKDPTCLSRESEPGH